MTKNTNQPPTFIERLLVIGIVIIAIVIGYEQGVRHATEVFIEMVRTQELIDGDSAGASITDCMEMPTVMQDGLIAEVDTRYTVE